MRITRIKRLQDFRIFREFRWPTNLPEFSRYNLIYGWNASGKTALSDLFRHLETKTPVTEGDVIVSIDGQDIRGSDFGQTAVPIRVFNRNFIADNVFKNGGVAAGVDPIYLLGKDNVEKQKEVNVLKVSLDQIQTSLQQLQDNYDTATQALDKFRKDEAKLIKGNLRAPDTDFYSNYDKSDFAAKANELSEEADIEGYKLDDNQRSTLLKQHQQTSPKDKVDEIAYTFPDLSTLFKEAGTLLARTVISSTINALADDSERAKWVHEGLSLHRDRDSGICLFCENALPENWLADLEAHFNEEYERFVKDIEETLATIVDLSNAADEFSAPDKARLYDDISSDYDNALTRCHAERKQVIAALDILDRNLQAKKAAVFVSESLASQAPQVDNTVLNAANAYIHKHNKDCDDFSTRVAEAREKLEAGYVVDALNEYKKLLKRKAEAKKQQDEAEQMVQQTQNEIARVERDIVSPRQAAEELNRDLREYLGHGELCLRVEATGYQITRNGQVANGLSEGEHTAIALLYFLKSLKDKDFDVSSGIVVLDDPVSSLDSNALFGAFGLIKDRSEDAAQLFVLTHNFTFFRQVRYWFHHLKGQRKKNIADRPARFYMLDCVREEESRCASIRWLDPLLEEYESEYHYLFRIVYDEAYASPHNELKSYYYLPNVARRLLETFLAFRCPQITNIWQQLQKTDFDGSKKSRIIRFLNTYSHGQVGESEHDLSVLAETQFILRDLLDLMKKEDPEHYLAMESLVNETDNTEVTQGT